MGRVKLRDLIGAIKDKASLSKAAFISKPSTLSLHLAVLRATTHSPSAPPDDKHLDALLTLGDASRATASTLVESLMDRLHRTKDASVALKCLLTIHHIIKRGPFILQDQLSVFPCFGGRNYLKLSAFRDGASQSTWALSVWVRWYARYLETLLSTSRNLGFFLGSTSSSSAEEKITSTTNLDLIRDVDSLVQLVCEIREIPDSLRNEGNRLLNEVLGFLGSDYMSAVNELVLRLGESRERRSCLSFGESVELMCALTRLEDCRERLTTLFTIKKPSMAAMWGLVGDLKILVSSLCKDDRKMVVAFGRRDKFSESARFDDRVVNFGNSVEFSSSRFALDKVSSIILESY